jgi:hypothetical protein
MAFQHLHASNYQRQKDSTSYFSSARFLCLFGGCIGIQYGSLTTNILMTYTYFSLLWAFPFLFLLFADGIQNVPMNRRKPVVDYQPVERAFYQCLTGNMFPQLSSECTTRSNHITKSISYCCWRTVTYSHCYYRTHKTRTATLAW